MLRTHNDEALLLFEFAIRVAARVKQYEAAAFEKEGGEHAQLQETVVDLCYSLLRVQIDILCPKDSNNYGILSKQSTRALVIDFDEYTNIKQLDDSCKDHITYVQSLNLAAAQERITRMEAEMDKRVRAEVARQFEQLAPYIVQDIFRSINAALRDQNANRRTPPPQNIADGQGSHDDVGSETRHQPSDQAKGSSEHASTSRDSQPESHEDSPTGQQTEG